AAVRRLTDVPEPVRRARARAQAERYTWPAAVDAFLAAHDAARLPAAAEPSR
ncbi:MAG: glycosyltransferase family 1 protein, partial [Actinomycetia bacterium]|nr:glycosyltransferase family 1 protein [Actinomycetes bacterium]